MHVLYIPSSPCIMLLFTSKGSVSGLQVARIGLASCPSAPTTVSSADSFIYHWKGVSSREVIWTYFQIPSFPLAVCDFKERWKKKHTERTKKKVNARETG